MLWWEMESWPTKNWGIGEKRLRTPGLEEHQPDLNMDGMAVLNMIRFLDRDPTGFCNSEPEPQRTAFRKKALPDRIRISKLC